MSAGGQDYLAQLEALAGAAEVMAAESARELQESQEQRAEAARDGSMGKDWQAVQRRIDAGQTTVGSVFTGEDTSPEAQRLLRMSDTNLTAMAEEMPDDLVEEIEGVEAQNATIGRAGITIVAPQDVSQAPPTDVPAPPAAPLLDDVPPLPPTPDGPLPPPAPPLDDTPPRT